MKLPNIRSILKKLGLNYRQSWTILKNQWRTNINKSQMFTLKTKKTKLNNLLKNTNKTSKLRFKEFNKLLIKKKKK